VGTFSSRVRAVFSRRAKRCNVAVESRPADFGDDEWLHMVCVEPANAAENAVTVAPGATHTMGMTVRLESMAR
jgi:D-hexose-6-phosphate mutarotase